MLWSRSNWLKDVLKMEQEGVASLLGPMCLADEHVHQVLIRMPLATLFA